MIKSWPKGATFLDVTVLNWFQFETFNPFQSDGLSLNFETLIQKNWDCPFCFLRGHGSKFIYVSSIMMFLCPYLANSAYPDAAFHLGLPCLLKYSLMGIQNKKGYRSEKSFVLSLSKILSSESPLFVNISLSEDHIFWKRDFFRTSMIQNGARLLQSFDTLSLLV